MNIDEKTQQVIAESEKTVKAVWEIDGITVYVREFKLEKGNVSVDWFTFKDDIDKRELGAKVEDLARKLLEEVTCSPTLFSRIYSSMKNIFA